MTEVEDEEPVPYVRRIAELGATRTDDVALTVVARDGSERTLTWGEVDARSNQLARAFTAAGVGVGGRVARVAEARSPHEGGPGTAPDARRHR